MSSLHPATFFSLILACLILSVSTLTTPRQITPAVKYSYTGYFIRTQARRNSPPPPTTLTETPQLTL